MTTIWTWLAAKKGRDTDNHDLQNALAAQGYNDTSTFDSIIHVQTTLETILVNTPNVNVSMVGGLFAQANKEAQAQARLQAQGQAQAQAQAQGLRQRRVHSHSTGVNNLQSSGSILPQANMSNRAIVTCAIEGYVGIQMLIIAGNCVFTWRGLYLWLHVKNAPKWKDNIDVDLAIYLATFLGLMIWLLVFTKCCYWKDGHSLASTFSFGCGKTCCKSFTQEQCSVFSLMIRSTIILAFIEIWEETHDVSVVATCIYFLYALAETIICVFEICYNIPAEQKRKNLESYEIALRRLHNKYGSTDATTTTDEERGLLDGDDAIPDTANNNDTNAQNSALEINLPDAGQDNTQSDSKANDPNALS